MVWLKMSMVAKSKRLCGPVADNATVDALATATAQVLAFGRQSERVLVSLAMATALEVEGCTAMTPILKGTTSIHQTPSQCHGWNQQLLLITCLLHDDPCLQ